MHRRCTPHRVGALSGTGGPASPGSRPPDVSVLVVARNVASTIRRQLEAVVAQASGREIEIVVVDHGSTDDTRAIVRGMSSPLVRLVDATEARGLAAARNVALATARGRLLLFADGDDEAATGWLDGMVSALEGADLVGCALDTGPLNSDSARRWRPPMPDGLPVAFGVLPYAPTAALGLRREVVDAIGGFDERFRIAAEDVDFCWRAQFAGFSLAYAGDAVMRYRLRDTPSAVMRQSYRYGVAGVRIAIVHAGRSPVFGGWRALADNLVGLARDAGLLLTPERPRWGARAAWLAGRVVGSVRHGRLRV